MKYKKKNDPDFWKIARSFLHEYMPVVRNLSDKSVEAYKQSLNSYLAFLKEELGIDNAGVCFETFNRENIKKYIVWLKERKNYSPKTISLKLTAIKSFLKYSSDEDIELRSFYTSICSIKAPKEIKKPIQYLAPEATKRILAATDTNTAKHRRNRMLLILMYDSGARVQELADLNISSLHLSENKPFITLIGKGRKTRNVPLMEKTILHLKEYLKEFHSSGAEYPLFYSKVDGAPHHLATDSISLILKNASDKARKECDAVPADVHCHLIRKTRAMDLYQNGIPLPIIAQMLGHESISTTTGFYAFATLGMMYDAMMKANGTASSDEKIWKTPEIEKVLYNLD